MTSRQRAHHDTRETLPDAPVVSAERSGRRAVVTLSGDLDADAEAEVSRMIKQVASLRGLDVLRLDTTNVTFIDSSGLRQLLLSSQVAADHAVELCIHVEEDGPVARLLELTGLDEVLPIVPISTA